MSTEETIDMFLKSTNWIRREMRSATKLPAKEMIPRIGELLRRSQALSREVNKFLTQHDQ